MNFQPYAIIFTKIANSVSRFLVITFHWLTIILQQMFFGSAKCSWQISVQSASIESNVPLTQMQLQKLHLKFQASNTWKWIPYM